MTAEGSPAGVGDGTSREAEESHSSSWVVEVEKLLADNSPDSKTLEAKRWEAQSIYLVPGWLKGATNKSKAYQPQLVSMGPFHHGDPNLEPMEEDKRRALVHLVRRSMKPLRDFISAIEDVAEQLEAAYGKDLDVKWRNDRDSFVEVMLTDGCFLLEMISSSSWDYELRDPVFSRHARIHTWPIIQSDMLMIENQLPLLVLRQIQGVRCPAWIEVSIEEEFAMNKAINRSVLEFLDRNDSAIGEYSSLGLHPLELYHRSLIYKNGPHEDDKSEENGKYEIMPTAVEMDNAGIKFSNSKTDSLLDIQFKDGVLTMPVLNVDDDTESVFLNLMAFERLHADAGQLVSAYVCFMDQLIGSAMDVAMLSSHGVLEHFLGCEEETAKMFNDTLSRGQLLARSSGLDKVQSDVKNHCGETWNKWRAALIRTHFRNPWAFISLAAAVILLIATLVQTAYTVMPSKS